MRFPNLACLLCKQPSAEAVCKFCKFDTRFLLHSDYRGNLLNYPAISRQFRHASYQGLRACGEYRWPLDTLIHRMKFQRCLLSANILAHWFSESCLGSETVQPYPELLLPVPIQLVRFYQRRFNQAYVIARTIADMHNLKVKADWASRQYSKAQHSLNRHDRLLNLRRTYQVHALEKTVRHVAIVDDVLTTGFTADVLARQLRQHNPRLKVEVWVIALTTARPLPDARYLLGQVR